MLRLEFDPDGRPTPTDALVRQVVVCPAGAGRDVLVDDFLRYFEPTARRVAFSLLASFRVDRNTWADEFYGVVLRATFVLLTDMANNPVLAEQVGSFNALLTVRSRGAITAMLDSSQGFTQASGVTTLNRRRRELGRDREHLVGVLGREPTDQEVVDATNTRMLAKRKDAAHQGMICSVEDLRPVSVSPYPAMTSVSEYQHVASNDTVEVDTELHPTETVDFIALTVKACAEVSEELALVARTWFRGVLEGDQNVAEVARQVGLDVWPTRRHVARVRDIAQTVAREQYGLRAG